MARARSAWVLGGLGLVSLMLGCGSTVNEVGKEMGAGGEDAGSGGSSQAGSGHVPGGGSAGSENPGGGFAGDLGIAGGNYGGSESGGFGGGNYGGSEFAGQPGGGFGGSGGYYSGGSGGYYSGGGAGGPSQDCFAPFETYSSDDQLDLAPQNAVALDVHRAQGDVRNSADQLLFPTSVNGIWETYANFPVVSAALAGKTDIALPAELASIPDNLAQFYVTRRSCAGRTVAGHKLLVEVWWEGGPHQMPTHGFALGAYDKKKKATTWFEDSTKAFVIGADDSTSLFDTLNRIQLVHTFASDDKTDARQLVLGLWLADTYVRATTFYVGNVQWD